MTVQGSLRKNENKRWEIVRPRDGRYELTSGDLIEVEVSGQWIRTRIECGIDGYYAVVRGVNLCNGLPARLPEQ